MPAIGLRANRMPGSRADHPNARVRLITAMPIELLATKLADELSQLSRRSPHSELVSFLASVVKDLESALHEARNADVYLTLEELAVRTKIPTSTLRRHCGRLQDRIGATKKSGSWIVHWPTFEAYLRSPGVAGDARAA